MFNYLLHFLGFLLSVLRYLVWFCVLSVWGFALWCVVFASASN